MGRRKIFCAALAAVLLFRVGGRVPAQENPPVLYAAGYEKNRGGKWAATVWKIDGSTVTPVVLTNGTWHAGVVGITGNGGSFYAAGYEENSGGNTAMVWKIEGSTVTPIPLTGGVQDAQVLGLAESGGSFYAAGWEHSGGGKRVAMVWKIDGSTVTPIPLTDGTDAAEAWGIAAIGSGGPPVLCVVGNEGDYGECVTIMAWEIYGW
ncbi:MAG: hypothetical protein LBK74_05250 [Treponema sp.]|jgi:hypothetical protein|nr:hypothetical protein [Treponema sp.]